MTTPNPTPSGAPLTSYTTDFPFRVLQIVSTGLVLVLALTAAMDILAEKWGIVVFELVLLVLLGWFGVRRSFALVRAAVTFDADGVRRRGAWSLEWEEISAAWVEFIKDVPHVVLLPRTVRAGTDLTRFFIRVRELPQDALLSPLDPHLAGEVRELLEARGFGRPTRRR